MMDNIQEPGIKYTMKINTGKTKLMKIGKEGKKVKLKLGEELENFKYLGGKIFPNGS